MRTPATLLTLALALATVAARAETSATSATSATSSAPTAPNAPAAPSETAATGAARVHVVLVDGGELQGELVEKVPGEAIVIQLATGEVRRVPWARIASVRAIADGAPAREPGETRDVIRGWPRPDRTPPTFRGERLTYGVTAGTGTATGYLGGAVGYSPAPWIELEIGAGLGGAFGPALGATARAGVPILGVIRLGVGVGYSVNWLSPGARAADGEHPGAPSLARFANFELFQDYGLGRRTYLRLVTGVSVLTNVHDYGGVCARRSDPGACAITQAKLPFGLDWAEAQADRGGSVVIPSFGLALMWLTP